jgi:3-deoxy-alpha-D-manno-octulosonate 8-oxidase
MQSKTDISIKWMGLEESFDRLRAEKYRSPYVILDGQLASDDRVLALLDRYALEAGMVLSQEPTTEQVNAICETLSESPAITSIVGIGGGSTMDLAKAVGVTAANGGKSELLQGWDLPKKKGLPTLVVPTIPGTGAEISRTAVLKGPIRKLGINSDFTIPDDCIVDPSLFSTVSKEYGVPTLLDCYIHCVEVVHGRFSDCYSTWASEEILERFEAILSRPYDPTVRENAELYAYCSYLGGLSLLGGVVGACHGLSYGLSHGLKISHSYANILAMNVLHDYYEDECEKVEEYCQLNDLNCWSKVSAVNKVSPSTAKKVSEGALFMEKLWRNAAMNDEDAIPKAKIAINQMTRLLEERL